MLGTLASGAPVLCHAANWWERAFATYGFSETSPDGCVITKTFRPFWLLPSELHRIPDADPEVRNSLGLGWVQPTFMRAYEAGTGTLLGESAVFDTQGSMSMDCCDPNSVGRRVLTIGGITMADTTRCADKVTLRKLEAAYERRRQGKWAMQGAL